MTGTQINLKIKEFRILLTSLIPLVLFACQNRASDYPVNPFNAGDTYISGSKLLQVSSFDTTGGNNDRINIHAGETEEIFNVSGPGVITRIWITIDSRDPHFLRRILLRMYWDDEENPSVEVPVGDFFGCGFQFQHHLAQYTGMSSGGYYCYFPMPFAKNARIEVVNDTREEIYAFYYHINYYQMNQSLPENMPYFHAQWKRDPRTDDKDNNYVALQAKGKGYFVGVNFNGQPYDGGLWYLEGDEMIYVDNEEFPSIYGTGFEDYFTSGWYFEDGEFSAPFHGLVLKDDSSGRITAYRHHVPDAIPFYDSIRVTFEHGHGNEEVTDFSTTAFWYQTEPHRPLETMPEAGLRIPLQRPVPSGAIEAEAVLVNAPADNAVKDMTAYGIDWSGHKQLEVNGKKGEVFNLSIPGLIEAAYDVDLYLTKGPDYGQLKVSTANGKPVFFEGYHDQIFPAPKVRISGIKPVDKKLDLTFEITGKTAASAGHKAGIDAIHLTPVRSFIDDWYIIGPFPNPRESDYLRFGLDSVYAPETEIDLKKEYLGVNDQYVSWQRLTGQAGYDMQLWRHIDPYELVVTYALTYIYSPEDQQVPFLIGTDDGAKVFLNDEQIYRFLDVRIAAPDQDRLSLNLKKGWNKLLIKAENNFGGYAFYARVIDINKNLVVNADKRR